MMCTINVDAKKTWITYFGVLCQLYQSLHSECKSRKLGQYTSHQKRKALHQHSKVDGTEWMHTLQPLKFCPIVLKFPQGNIVLNLQVKAHNSWVAGVEFLQEASKEMTEFTTALKKKNMNDLHIEFGIPLEEITHYTTKSMGIQVTSTFIPCEHCVLGK